MARPIFLPALIALSVALGALPAVASTDPATTPSDADGATPTMPDKIREKLSQDGYKDITVMPTSYAVSATDKDGKPVLLLIGPSSAQTLQEAPSTAQSPPGKHELIQE
jgi:hypothetical protein